MDQVIEVTRHLSSKGIHHEVHLFFHHLHLRDYVRGSRICDGWSIGILSLLSAWGVATFRLLLIPSWSSSWVLSAAFFWCSYSSRSWFFLVRCSIATARVWTCLSRAVVRGSSPWLLVVVAIERVSTMQLFVWEVGRYSLSLSVFPQMMPTDDAENCQ